MKRESKEYSRRYEEALLRYLEQGPKASLEPAARLGREAVALGLDTLALALVHERFLLDHLSPADSIAVRERIGRRARAFLAEALLPLEETHQAALDTNAQLNRLNETLHRSTLDLAASNRELKKQIARRLAAEKTLRRSEQRSVQLLAQSRRLQEQLRHLSGRVLTAQEEERKRISRDLHDVIVQTLTGISFRLATLKKEAAVNAGGITRNISRTQRLVEKSVDLVHRFARRLRPAALDDLGLIPALHSFMKNFTRETGVRVDFTAFAGVEKLEGAKRTVLFRVAQEALGNVARHAQATRVEASIQSVANAVRMQIKDDGKAFDVERVLHSRRSRRLGLLGMRERVVMVGGTFTIESVPGQGTTIQVQIPFRNGTKR